MPMCSCPQALWTVLRHLASNEDASALWIDTTGDVAVDQAGVAVKSMEGKVGCLIGARDGR